MTIDILNFYPNSTWSRTDLQPVYGTVTDVPFQLCVPELAEDSMQPFNVQPYVVSFTIQSGKGVPMAVSALR